jgi:DNA-binding GntR family transcriptional regulator
VTRPDNVAVAHETLRELILRGDLAPGSELSQVALARRLGLSTTPLREALRQLEAEGLLDAPRNRRPRVRAFEIDDLDSVYASRILLESLALELTVPALADADRAALRGDLAAMRRAGERRQATSWELAHARFHHRLVGGAPAPLREQITTLMARGDRYRRISVRRDDPRGRAAGDAEHEAIVAACEAGDGAGAAALLAGQLARSAHTVRDKMAGEAALVAVARAVALLSRPVAAARIGSVTMIEQAAEASR